VVTPSFRRAGRTKKRWIFTVRARCIALLVQAFLGCAFLASGGTVLPAVAQSPRSLITDAQLEKLLRALQEHGKDLPIQEPVADKLGLAGDDRLMIRHLGVPSSPGFGHAFHTLSDGGYLLVVYDRFPLENYFYRLDKALNLVVAVAATPDQIEHMPFADSQYGAARELRFWAAVADQL
jgi:hypothetical protein